MSILVDRFGAPLPNEADRLRILRAGGRTVELATLTARDRIIRVWFAFGPEFWTIEGDFSINVDELIVENGSLITDQSEPVRNARELRKRGLRFEDAYYSF